ncbi:hypothetical protein L6452_06527 [Arctium lappa]|uniref:Uncharacterized protein n=1 Tax=Arctium lappa TaxID=4217 RepID=A0ACB9EJ56_ARCLA|nr:hypothetical protein L6452_06527 [Arctium lappa]
MPRVSFTTRLKHIYCTFGHLIGAHKGHKDHKKIDIIGVHTKSKQERDDGTYQKRMRNQRASSHDKGKYHCTVTVGFMETGAVEASRWPARLARVVDEVKDGGWRGFRVVRERAVRLAMVV